MLLKDKNIVITGAGRGIGKNIAIAFAKEGANLGLISRTLEELEQTKKEIEELFLNGKVIIKSTDITKYEDVAEAFKLFNEGFGLINGVIANAGASRMGSTHEFDNDRFSNIVNVNILGVYHTFKACYPYLKKDDKKAKARFLITGSAAFPNAMPKFAAYTATKYATVGLQRSMVLEYKKENITFNQILPTMVDTRLSRGRKTGDGNKPDSVMNPWDLNDYYLFFMSDLSNRVNDKLIYTSDFQEIKTIISEAPSDKTESWDVFKDYLMEKTPKIYENVKKLGTLVDFVINQPK
ncbi:MAG: SDR family NAD(P)-dependent oxidoreductase [Promethearchaeota archaeon]